MSENRSLLPRWKRIELYEKDLENGIAPIDAPFPDRIQARDARISRGVISRHAGHGHRVAAREALIESGDLDPRSDDRELEKVLRERRSAWESIHGRLDD